MEGLTWDEKLLMRRARNAAASRNRRRLKKLGVLTRNKRRTLVTLARTTEDEAAAAALQTSPQEAAPPSKIRVAKRKPLQASPGEVAPPSRVHVAKRKPGRPRLSTGVAVRRSVARRVLADAEIDSEPPYVAVVIMESSPDVDDRSDKPATSDQRRQRRRDSPGGSTLRETRIDRRSAMRRNDDSHDVSLEKGSSQSKETLMEDEPSDIASKTRSRSMTHLTELPTKRHFSRDVSGARDSRAKRRYTASVDREGKVGGRKHSRMNRTVDNAPSSSGPGRREEEGDSSPEVKPKRPKSRPQGEYNSENGSVELMFMFLRNRH